MKEKKEKNQCDSEISIYTCVGTGHKQNVEEREILVQSACVARKEY